MARVKKLKKWEGTHVLGCKVEVGTSREEGGLGFGFRNGKHISSIFETRSERK
jgi:hypothetical protein